MEKHTEPVSVELLSEMYRNVTMGSENLSTVIPKISDKFLLSNVTNQLEKYADFTKKTEKLLQKYDVKPKEATVMKKMMSRGGITMNTLFDASDSHIAEMIARGTKLGLEQLENKMHDFKGRSDNEAITLCRDIIVFEQKEAQKMHEYT